MDVAGFEQDGEQHGESESSVDEDGEEHRLGDDHAAVFDFFGHLWVLVTVIAF